MSKFLSGREREFKVGIVSYTENNTVLQVVGNSNFTGIVTAAYFYGDGSNLTNIPIVGAAATVAISTTAPVSPTEGDLWFNSELGRTFVYYNDGSSYSGLILHHLINQHMKILLVFHQMVQ